MNPPLPKNVAETLIQTLLGVAKAHRLYPAGHPAIRNGEEALARSLNPLFRTGEPVVLGYSDGHLTVGGVAFLGDHPHARELGERLAEHEVEGVVLQPRVRSVELSRFCQWLNQHPAPPWKGDAIVLTRLEPAGTAWERGVQLYRNAVETVENIYRDVASGNTPDPQHARGTVRSLSALLDENPLVGQGLALIKDYDRYTFHHSVNVCLLSLGMGRQDELDDHSLECLGVGALFHDIGKTRTPGEVVRKAGRLSPDEWALMVQHPILGRELVEQMLGTADDISRLVFEHHMHYNGGGYPSRQTGYGVLELSPLVSVADVFDAITSHRPYNRPLSPADAVQVLADERGTTLQPAAVDTFLATAGTVPVGTVVRLATGELAVVARAGVASDPMDAVVVRNAAGVTLSADQRYSVQLSDPQSLHAVDPLSHRINPLEVLHPVA